MPAMLLLMLFAIDFFISVDPPLGRVRLRLRLRQARRFYSEAVFIPYPLSLIDQRRGCYAPALLDTFNVSAFTGASITGANISSRPRAAAIASQLQAPFPATGSSVTHIYTTVRPATLSMTDRPIMMTFPTISGAVRQEPDKRYILTLVRER